MVWQPPAEHAPASVHFGLKATRCPPHKHWLDEHSRYTHTKPVGRLRHTAGTNADIIDCLTCRKVRAHIAAWVPPAHFDSKSLTPRPGSPQSTITPPEPFFAIPHLNQQCCSSPVSPGVCLCLQLCANMLWVSPAVQAHSQLGPQAARSVAAPLPAVWQGVL